MNTAFSFKFEILFDPNNFHVFLFKLLYHRITYLGCFLFSYIFSSWIKIPNISSIFSLVCILKSNVFNNLIILQD